MPKEVSGTSNPSSFPGDNPIIMSPAHKKRKLSPPAVGNSNLGLPQSVPSGDFHGEEGDVADYAIHTRIRKPVRIDKVDRSKVLSAGAYSSNMFQLQVDELLAKVRPAKGRMVKAENALHKLKDIIEHLPNREPKPVRHSLNSIYSQV